MLNQRRRQPRMQRIFLGTTSTVVVSIIAAAVMLLFNQGGIATLCLSLPLAVAAAVESKARGLFKGPNLPLIPTFLMLQAVEGEEHWLQGNVIAILSFVFLLTFFFCFMHKEETRTIYTVYLVSGLLAMVMPFMAVLAVIFIPIIATMRAFSLRGLTAAVLGFITPWFILGLWCIYAMNPIEIDFPEISLPMAIGGVQPLFSELLCVIAGLMTFITSYGYPAKARARNMAIYVLSFGAIAGSLLWYDSYFVWLPLLNLCTAYHIVHLAATRRAGWAFVMTIWVGCAVIILHRLCIF